MCRDFYLRCPRFFGFLLCGSNPSPSLSTISAEKSGDVQPNRTTAKSVIPFTKFKGIVKTESSKLTLEMYADLKGLSHEMDLTFDDMHGQFQAQIGDEASLKFFRCSNDFIMQKCISRG